MPEFMIELYAPSAVVAEAATRLARHIEVLRSIYVAEDETCFVFVKAAAAEDVRAAAGRARLELERVVETTFDTGERPILRGER
jgi:hypothetical protein